MPGEGGMGNGERFANRYEVSFGGDENILNLKWKFTLWIYKKNLKIKLYSLSGQIAWCELYLKKAIF